MSVASRRRAIRTARRDDQVQALTDAWLRLPYHERVAHQDRYDDLHKAVSRLTAHHVATRRTITKEQHMNSEPVVSIASITAAVAALIGLLVAFGVDLSDDQQKAILAVVAVVGPLVAGAVSRGKVTPVSKL